MRDLVDILEGIGARNVKTYVQSGNAVYQSTESNLPKFSKKLSWEINKRRGFEPQVLILELGDIERAMAMNPFPDAESDPPGLHLGFLASVPKSPDLSKLDSIRKESERFQLIGSVFYLHAPEGIGRSKLATGSEKLLGVAKTDRNWRTICKIWEIAKELGDG